MRQTFLVNTSSFVQMDKRKGLAKLDDIDAIAQSTSVKSNKFFSDFTKFQN